MPRTRSLAYAELKVGLLSAAAIATVAFVIFSVGGGGGFFWERYHLKARFASVAGLKPGAPVRVAGVEVGTVRGLRFDGVQVEVTFELSKAMRSRVTTDSIAALGTLSLLGQSTVDIMPALTGAPVPEWGYVRTGTLPGQIADVAASASRGLDETTRLIQDLRRGQGSVGRLFADDSVFRHMDALLASADAVARGLERGRGTLGRLMQDPQAYDKLVESLDTLNAMLRRINSGEGTMGQLMSNRALADSVTSAAGNLDTFVQRVNKGEGTAGRLVNDPVLYDRLAQVADRLDRLTERLDQGEGTAGQLLQDRRLYENMSGVAAELRGLVADIRRDPKKYLNVKMSLF
jgi:phospholipid/cholesterol/gamma-HCH transport system substrate-binding protein